MSLHSIEPEAASSALPSHLPLTASCAHPPDPPPVVHQIHDGEIKELLPNTAKFQEARGLRTVGAVSDVTFEWATATAVRVGAYCRGSNGESYVLQLDLQDGYVPLAIFSELECYLRCCLRPPRRAPQCSTTYLHAFSPAHLATLPPFSEATANSLAASELHVPGLSRPLRCGEQR